METYRDHPLAFLCGRTSPSTLRYRAENWRAKGHDAMGIDVAGIFDRSASNIESVRQSLADVLAMVRAEAPMGVISSQCGEIEVDVASAGEAIETAQFMRQNMLDPYGGSVCASLEQAWEELSLLESSVESVITLAETTGSHAGIESVLLEALDMVKVPEATHEAPRAYM
jgi:hypothetical protein